MQLHPAQGTIIMRQTCTCSKRLKRSLMTDLTAAGIKKFCLKSLVERSHNCCHLVLNYNCLLPRTSSHFNSLYSTGFNRRILTRRWQWVFHQMFSSCSMSEVISTRNRVNRKFLLQVSVLRSEGCGLSRAVGRADQTTTQAPALLQHSNSFLYSPCSAWYMAGAWQQLHSSVCSYRS